MKIFISYCGDDTAHKNHLKESLIPLINEYKELGTELEIVEMSTHCAGDWDEWMIPAVKSCDIFVPLITDNAMYPKSGVPKRMLEELTTARNTNKKMVPVIMSVNGVSDTFQAHIGRISQVWYAYDTDGDGDPFDEAVSKIRILVNAILKKDSVDQGESVDIIGCGVVQNTRFVGRVDYIDLLDKELDSTNVVILKGDGGIGKTSLAENFFFKSEKYKRAYLVSATEGIRSGICNIRFRSTEYVKNEDERYSANYSLLKALGKDTIVILDNCDTILDEYELYQLVDRMDCKFIITSRIGRTDYSHEIKINPMDKKELLALVYKHFPDIAEENDLDDDEVERELYKFFDSVGCHTLTVEMASIIMRDGEIEIKEAHDAIMKCNERFKTKHSGARIASPFEHLSTLYNYAELSPTQREILSFMCLVSPTSGITRKELKGLLELDGLYHINELVDKTFIRKTDKSLTMHPLFSDVFFSAEKIAENKELCDRLFDKMAEWLLVDTSSYDIKVSTRLVETISFLKSKRMDFLTSTEDTKEQLPYMYVNMGRCYTDLGRFKEAEEILLEVKEYINSDSDYTLDSAIYIALGGLYELTGRFEEAIEYNKKTLKIYELMEDTNQVDDSYIFSKVAALASTGRCYSALGRYEEASSLIEEALETLKTESDLDDEDNIEKIIECYNSLIVLYADMGNPKAGINLGAETFEFIERLSDEGNRDGSYAITYNNLAYASQKLLDTASAITFFEKTLELYDKIYEGYPDHIQYASIYNNLGMAYLMMNEGEKSIEYLNKALEIFEKAYESATPLVAKIYGNKGQAYLMLGDTQKAYIYTKKGIDMYKELYGDEVVNADVAIAYGNMGLALYYGGQKDEALSYLHSAIDGYESTVGDSDSTELGGIYSLTAVVYAGKGDYTSALKYARSALEIRKSLLYNTGFNVNIALTYGLSLVDVCICLKSLGETEEAIKYGEEAVSFFENLEQESHQSAITAYNTLISLYKETGDMENAQKYLKKLSSVQGAQESIQSSEANEFFMLANKSAIELNSGDIRVAVSLCDKALEIYESNLETMPNRADVIQTLQVISSIYSCGEEYQKSIISALRARVLAEKIGAPNDTKGTIEYQIAEAYYCCDALTRALEHIEEAIKLFEATDGYEDESGVLSEAYELRDTIKSELE